jgi:hypothetical protein
MRKILSAAFIGATAYAMALAASAQAATTYTVVVVPATQRTNTGVAYSAGQTVTVTATGTAAWGSDGVGKKDLFSGPAGNIHSTIPTYIDPSCPFMSLIGQIGSNGPYHCLGAKASFVADGDGDLLLVANDGNLTDNAGAYEALIAAP